MDYTDFHRLFFKSLAKKNLDDLRNYFLENWHTKKYGHGLHRFPQIIY